MPLGKQAKTLSKPQIEAVLGYLASTRHATRNRLIFLLSVRAGLRAKEIAALRWSMVTDAQGDLDDCIRLQDSASKGRSGRIIPMQSELRDAFSSWREGNDDSGEVICSERADRVSAQSIVNMFAHWYQQLGLVECSSHSGRRTFITLAARKITLFGGSIRDVQLLAGHENLKTTQRYIDENPEAQRRVIDAIAKT